jgi:hypothetical protein
MRVRFCPVFLLILSMLPPAALAQSQPASTVRTVLAAGRLASVVDTPLYFRLFRVALPATQDLRYSGPNAMLYDLSGTVALNLDGGNQPIAEGAGALIPAGHPAVITAAATERTSILLFILAPASDLQQPLIRTTCHRRRVVPDARAAAGPQTRALRIQPDPRRVAVRNAGEPAALPVRRGVVLHPCRRRAVQRRGQDRAEDSGSAAFRALRPGPSMGQPGRYAARSSPSEYQPGRHSGGAREITKEVIRSPGPRAAAPRPRSPRPLPARYSG